MTHAALIAHIQKLLVSPDYREKRVSGSEVLACVLANQTPPGCNLPCIVLPRTPHRLNVFSKVEAIEYRKTDTFETHIKFIKECLYGKWQARVPLRYQILYNDFAHWAVIDCEISREGCSFICVEPKNGS